MGHVPHRINGFSMACPARSARILIFIGVSVTAALCGWASNSVTAQPVERGAISNRQPELLARTLAPLKATSANQRQIYFVGFAGYGRQAVFKREVLAVRQLFDDRFGTKERSVALVNHPSTVKEIPLASVGNLDDVLQHVGKLMDARRDTLFLFLSSHGERGIVAVEMPGLALTQVRPEHLKRMLDRSAIKRRVVVVSSCHSGSFIPALADPNTLVITLSRRFALRCHLGSCLPSQPFLPLWHRRLQSNQSLKDLAAPLMGELFMWHSWSRSGDPEGATLRQPAHRSCRKSKG
jgi:hypothetical protein